VLDFWLFRIIVSGDAMTTNKVNILPIVRLYC